MASMASDPASPRSPGFRSPSLRNFAAVQWLLTKAGSKETKVRPLDPSRSVSDRSTTCSDGSPRESEDASPTAAEHVRKLPAGRTIFDLFTKVGALQECTRRPVYLVKQAGVPGAPELVLKVREKGQGRTHGADPAQILGLSDCRHILGFEQVYEDDKYYYLLMRKCTGGELFNLLVQPRRCSEAEAKRLMRQLLHAVDHLHQHGLLHRDIKPENLLLDGPRGHRTLKLIDFDTCLEFDPTAKLSYSPMRMQRVTGTQQYIAPESFRGEYSARSDLWSCGVILHVLITGNMPFDHGIYEDAKPYGLSVGGGVEQMDAVLRAQRIDWSHPNWAGQGLARDLCRRLLVADPRKRTPDARSVLTHTWFR